MNKNKKNQIAKLTARNILFELKSANYFDGFDTRFYSKIRCINYIQKNIAEYFRSHKQLVNWNKDTWFDIFDDKELVDNIVWYMQEFNLSKELEEENEK